MKELLRKIPGLVWSYHLARSWFGALLAGRPSEKIYVIGVTGTKGKTTTLELLNAVLEAAGKKTALISSLRLKIGAESQKNQLGNSMPGRGYLQLFLRQAVAAGCTYAIIEVTSQGVAQSRHRFINWNAAILTNLSPEHIESHGGFENYRGAKLEFLRYVAGKRGKTFLNRDDASYDFFSKALNEFQPISYSRNDEEVLRILPQITPVRSAADIMPSPFLLSDFNKTNIAAAVALVREIGIGEKAIEEGLRHFKGVPGRMEFVQWRPFTAVIDYAHTPDSLEAAYKAVRELMTNGLMTNSSNFGHMSSVTGQRLICVLGSAGGGRDKWKRPAMGKIAAEYCDKIILTDEDPYDENSGEIIQEISAGFSRAPGGTYHTENSEKIADRREAIKKAVSLAKPGDVVIITGKGSEDWIHVARAKKIPWSEREAVQEALAQAKKILAPVQ